MVPIEEMRGSSAFSLDVEAASSSRRGSWSPGGGSSSNSLEKGGGDDKSSSIKVGAIAVTNEAHKEDTDVNEEEEIIFVDKSDEDID